MKSLVYTGAKQLEYLDTPDPQPAEGEVLMRVESVGICGSDMHAYLGHDERRPAPLILGHEAAGVIITGSQAGKRVTVNPLVTCGKCGFCQSGRENLCTRRQIISMPPREGAFAQFIAMPSRNLVEVPDGVSLDHAALTEPIACGWHACRLAEGVLHCEIKDANVLIIGGGAIGVGAALSLKARGNQSVSVLEPNAERRTFLLSRLGLTASGPDDLESQSAFDLVIDAAGFGASRAEASKRVLPGGVIVHIGLGEAAGGLDIRRMTLQEITFIGTYTYTVADFRETAEAIFSGAMGELDWVERRHLEDGAGAFQDLLEGRVHAPKMILKPGHS